MKHFLFLQGLPGPFFKKLAKSLLSQSQKVTLISLCPGDSLFLLGLQTLKYRGRQKNWPSFIKQFLKEKQVTDVIVLGEERNYHQQALTFAREMNINVITTDFGYLRPDWITLEKNGSGKNSVFPKTATELATLASNLVMPDLKVKYQEQFWRLALYDISYHWINILGFLFYPFYKRPYKRPNALIHYPMVGKRLLFSRKKDNVATRIINQLINNNTPYFILPLQLENDFQISHHSPFSNLTQVLQKVIHSFSKHANSHQHLVIKIHPLDYGLKNWQTIITKISHQYNANKRVHFIEGGNLEKLIKNSLGMVTVNSSCGIKALLSNTPIKVLGTAIYDINGLTHRRDLDDFWQNKKNPDKNVIEDFFKVLTHSNQIRGNFYHPQGLDNAVNLAAKRLITNAVGKT